MILNSILLIIFFATLAMLFREGLWSNALTLFNVVFAGLLATTMWEPVADWFDSMFPTRTYWWDFVSLWAVFGVSFIILRAVSDTISRIRVRLKAPVDMTGSVVLSLIIGWVLVSFVTVTLHTAPLAADCLGGKLQPSTDSKTFLMTAPDRHWLGFVQSVSRGALGKALATGEDGLNVFDPQSEFIFKYGQRRAILETETKFAVQR